MRPHTTARSLFAQIDRQRLSPVTLLLGTLLWLRGDDPIATVLLAGYFLRVVRTTDAFDEAPTFGDLRALAASGVGITALAAAIGTLPLVALASVPGVTVRLHPFSTVQPINGVYTWPVAILFGPLGVGPSVDPLAVLGLVGAAVLAALAGYVLTVVFLRYAHERSVRRALDPDAVARVARSTAFLGTWLVAAVGVFLGRLTASLAGVLPLFGDFLGGLVGFGVAYAVALFVGRGYRSIPSTPPTPAASTARSIPPAQGGASTVRSVGGATETVSDD